MPRTIEELAAEIGRLQRGRTAGASENRIRRLFLGQTGERLTRLKTLIDGGSDHRDLHQLVFHDIDNSEIREELIEHFQNHSSSQPQVRIITDIDDTLYASLKERRYPSGTRYPGVLQFHREFPSPPILLTARPWERTGMLERLTQRQMSRLGLESVVVLGGKFRALLSHRRMGLTKLTVFQQYVKLYPELRFVFVGDSGQGDVVLAERLQELFPDQVVATLIHQLGRESVRDRVPRFHTYAEAANLLHGRGLISREGVLRVAQSCLEELDTLKLASGVRSFLESSILRAFPPPPGAGNEG